MKVKEKRRAHLHMTDDKSKDPRETLQKQLLANTTVPANVPHLSSGLLLRTVTVCGTVKGFLRTNSM